MRKVQIVYYLSYGGGHFEHPHLLEVSTFSTGLYLRDVKRRLSSLRGSLMPSYFSWSYKRSYKRGYVWHDLESDDDPIFPMHDGSEYVLMGCKIEPSCIVQTIASPPKMLCNATVPIDDVPTLVQPLAIQVAELPSGEDTMAGSSSNASLHVSDDNIMVKLGITESSEHLHVIDQEINNPDFEAYPESQASTSVDHSNAMDQHNPFHHRLNIKGECSFQQPSVEEDAAFKGQIVPHYGSEFTVIITKAERSGTSYKSSQYGAVADAATQTGTDDESPMPNRNKSVTAPSTYNNLSQYHDQLPGPPLQATGSLASTSREGLFSPHNMVTTENVAMSDLSKEEISPPPCSTSSSTFLSSAHSASSSNSVLGLGHPRLSLDQSTGLAEDQILQEKDLLLSASGNESTYNAYFAKANSTVIKGCTSGDRNCDDPVCSTNFCTAGDSKLPKLDSSNMKAQHALSNICSSSGRFLHLVSCTGGLDVINPTRRNSGVSHAVCCKETSSSTELPLRNAKNDAACMHISRLANVSSENVKNDAQEVGTSLPYVTHDDVLSCRRCLSLANAGDASSCQEGSSSIKKLWHLKGWVDSQYKKIKASKEVSKAALQPI